jgi:3-methyladenine DNA glycosylase/8-oxoguanine DNA glycosylase
MIEEDIHIRFIQRFGKVENFVHSITPFEHICKCANYLDWKWIENKLGDSGLGCWRRKSRTVRELCLRALNLKTCSIENLESIWGIGPKTARCFLMHSRKGMRVAGLDTHVLKFLGTKGIAVPKSTPTGKRYKVLEEAFLKLCDEVGKEPAEYDLEIWNKYAKTT